MRTKTLLSKTSKIQKLNLLNLLIVSFLMIRMRMTMMRTIVSTN